MATSLRATEDSNTNEGRTVKTFTFLPDPNLAITVQNGGRKMCAIPTFSCGFDLHNVLPGMTVTVVDWGCRKALGGGI